MPTTFCRDVSPPQHPGLSCLLDGGTVFRAEREQDSNGTRKADTVFSTSDAWCVNMLTLDSVSQM